MAAAHRFDVFANRPLAAPTADIHTSSEIHVWPGIIFTETFHAGFTSTRSAWTIRRPVSGLDDMRFGPMVHQSFRVSVQVWSVTMSLPAMGAVTQFSWGETEKTLLT